MTKIKRTITCDNCGREIRTDFYRIQTQVISSSAKDSLFNKNSPIKDICIQCSIPTPDEWYEQQARACGCNDPASHKSIEDYKDAWNES